MSIGETSFFERPRSIVTSNHPVADLYWTDHAYLDTFPNVKRFLVEMSERPAYQRALQTTMPKGPPPM